MQLEAQFETFLQNIRLTTAQRNELKDGHQRLRARLFADAELAPRFVNTFLQGSYRRHTAVRPKGDKRADVDVVVVTKLSEDQFTPQEAMDLFAPFLDRHYEGKWRQQGRSIGIEMAAVDFDLVITSAPSEAEIMEYQAKSVTTDEDLVEAVGWRLNDLWQPMSERLSYHGKSVDYSAMKEAPEWKLQPLHIPDLNAKAWTPTHPLEQYRWTVEKNRDTNTHFVNVVKALKWWRLESHPDCKHPKGFPLERIVGDCCPNQIESVAEGVVATLEEIVQKYQPLVMWRQKPQLMDYGVPDHDVLKRLSYDQFEAFYQQSAEAANLARRAFDADEQGESRDLWAQLFGPKFPLITTGTKSNVTGFSRPSGPATPGTGRFA